MTKNKKIIVTELTALIILGLLCLSTFILSPNQKVPHDVTSRNSNNKNQSSKSIATKDTTNDSKSNNNQQVAAPEHSVATLQTPKKVLSVQLDSSTPTFKTKTGEVFPLRTYKTLAPNDPYATQWWTSSTGLDTAWDIGAGSTQTIVAVIDTGFSLKHEEFADRWATNSGEQGVTSSQASSKLNCTDRGISLNMSCNLIDDDFDGIVDNETGTTTSENPSQLNCTDQNIELNKSCNLIDDDDNGYIDDVTGWDFANYDLNTQAGEINPDAVGSGTTHGTKVSGILAATGNNSKGIAGVNWTTKILPLQAIDDDGYGNTLTVARSVIYAADRDADVINISLGSDLEDTYLRQAIQYAIDKNSIVVAASGNESCDCMLYPARYPEVFAVGSYNSSGVRSTFSSYGFNLDILAPGEDVITATWTKANPTNSYASSISGTSFSAPYVSGLLSLARSHQPNASWGELTNSLLMAANHTGLSTTNPSSTLIGSGYAKADSLINRVTTPTTPGMRYIFGPSSGSGTLGSTRLYQCYMANDFPTAPLYEITTQSSIYYTIDTLENIRALENGDTVNSLGRTCVGLPTDMPVTIRSINLLREIRNLTNYKQ